MPLIALGSPRSLPYRTIYWHDPLRGAYASIGRMVGIRTHTEVRGMIPDNTKRPDVVYTSENGQETLADVVTCCPVLLSATTNNCDHGGLTGKILGGHIQVQGAVLDICGSHPAT